MTAEFQSNAIRYRGPTLWCCHPALRHRKRRGQTAKFSSISSLPSLPSLSSRRRKEGITQGKLSFGEIPPPLSSETIQGATEPEASEARRRAGFTPSLVPTRRRIGRAPVQRGSDSQSRSASSHSTGTPLANVARASANGGNIHALTVPFRSCARVQPRPDKRPPSSWSLANLSFGTVSRILGNRTAT